MIILKILSTLVVLSIATPLRSQTLLDDGETPVQASDKDLNELEKKYQDYLGDEKSNQSNETKVNKSEERTPPPPPKRSPEGNSLLSEVPEQGEDSSLSAGGNTNNLIPIKRSGNRRRGINIKTEVPTVTHITMTPATRDNGGDDVEITVSPIFETLMVFPEEVTLTRTRSQSLKAEKTEVPNIVSLQLENVNSIVPTTLHIITVSEEVYTFTVIGGVADLSIEYPKTLFVNKRKARKIAIGHRNPSSIVNAMNTEDAIQMVVGGVPNVNEYNVKFEYSNYMHHEGYAMYAFTVSRRDKSSLPRNSQGKPDLKFTFWANDRRLDAGNKYARSRTVEWTIDDGFLSRRASQNNGYETLKVFVQIKASILDLEEWESSFITVSDQSSYTRLDFEPMIRNFRAPKLGKK